MIETLSVSVSPGAARLVQSSGPCDNCGCHDSTFLFNNQDYISGETFAVIQCAQCQLARTAIAPDTDLEAYYGPAYYGDEARRFQPFIERAIARFRDQRADSVSRLRLTPGRILDIGCGRGLMLSELKRRGWESVGTEQSPNLAHAISQKTGLPVHSGPTLSACRFESGEFDVVTLWHVLEHMPDPVQTLREIHRIVKPGGFIVVEVPNLQSWQARLGAGVWFHLDTPRHLYHFSASQLQHTLAEQGFRTTDIHTFSLEYGPFGMCQTLLNRLTHTPNVLYRWLKRTKLQSAHKPPLHWRDTALTIACIVPVTLVAVGLEVSSAIFNSGGIVRIVAQKTHPYA